jgi:hypothetical protein
MTPPSVDFRAAFDRWNRVCSTEQKDIAARMVRHETHSSWEALDHLCGLAAEVGMKYLLLKKRVALTDTTG